MTMKNNTSLAQFCLTVLRKAAFSICPAACTLGLGISASAQQLSFTTFNVAAAGTSAYQGTIGASVNPDGEIVGYYSDSNDVYHAFLRSPEGMIRTFDAPHSSTDGYGTFGIALNAEGSIVGFYTNSQFNYGGFLRRPDGTFVTYRYPAACTTGDPVGCEGTGFAAINALGAIAGGYVDNNFVAHALLLKPDGAVIEYDAPGAGTTPSSYPAPISPLGDYLYQGTNLAGISPGLNVWGTVTSAYLDENYVYHGYLRSPNGTFTDFEAPNAGEGLAQGTIPTSLNDWGLITGYYLDSNGVFHGFQGSPSSITDFDAPGADGYGTFPASLNDCGAITGYYLDASGVYHGFLLNPDGKFTTFDAPGADLTPGDFNGTFPSSINPFGAITGNYVDVNNVSHGFVAVPCNRGCFGNEEASTAATRVSSALTTNQVNRAFPGVLNPKLRLIPRNRSVEVQPSK